MSLPLTVKSHSFQNVEWTCIVPCIFCAGAHFEGMCRLSQAQPYTYTKTTANSLFPLKSNRYPTPNSNIDIYPSVQVILAGFNPNYGLFTATPDGYAYPQPAAAGLGGGLGLLEFLGSIVGKALYEGILLDYPLAAFFVRRLQGHRPMFDDLAALDPELHRSLVQLKRCVTQCLLLLYLFWAF